MIVGKPFTYQSKRSQATFSCSQRRGEPDDNSDSQLVCWPPLRAFLGDTSSVFFQSIRFYHMVYSFNVLGCQLICNVGRQLEAVLNI
jgi:hypothetical protein